MGLGAHECTDRRSGTQQSEMTERISLGTKRTGARQQRQVAMKVVWKYEQRKTGHKHQVGWIQRVLVQEDNSNEKSMGDVWMMNRQQKVWADYE